MINGKAASPIKSIKKSVFACEGAQKKKVGAPTCGSLKEKHV